MEEEILLSLLDKYLAGTATELEKKKLNEWYAQQSNVEVIWETESLNEEHDVEQRMKNYIQGHVRSSKTKIFKLNRFAFGKVAAVLIGGLVLSGIYFTYNNKSKTALIKTASIDAPTKFSENRFITLPDSSTVILRPGSEIQYKFDNKTRQVTLIGEGYFNIKHIISQPFIIHAGNVITTVLGTAFNIKAYKGQNVIVSVTRGKVSVQNEHSKTLAILLPNQQVEYSNITRTANLHNVKAQEVITWAKADMQFNDMPFDQVAEKLSRRYDMKIDFKNPGLENCLITGRFNGTESLDQVFKILTETMNCNYKIDGQVVTVDGVGCNNAN